MDVNQSFYFFPRFCGGKQRQRHRITYLQFAQPGRGAFSKPKLNGPATASLNRVNHGRTRLYSTSNSKYAAAYRGAPSPHLLTALADTPSLRANSAFVIPARLNKSPNLISILRQSLIKVEL